MSESFDNPSFDFSSTNACTIVRLAERLKMDVTVFAKKFIPETTSNITGGQWAPSKVEFRPNEKARFQTILRKAAFADHLHRGEAFGVSRRTNYSLREIEHFKLVPTDVVLPPTRLNLPFFEPPIFLSKLHRELEAGATRFVQKSFSRSRTCSRFRPTSS